jgi:hypothetical protein
MEATLRQRLVDRGTGVDGGMHVDGWLGSLLKDEQLAGRL